MRDTEFHLKKWEIALLASVGVTVLVGMVWGRTDCLAWWGTMYPELTGEAGGFSAAAVTDGSGEVLLRFRCAAWFSMLLKWLGYAAS